MLTHINLKNFPFPLIQRLKTVESVTGLRMEYMIQAALLQGLCGYLDKHSGVESGGSESEEVHVSVGTAGGVMVPCSGDAVVPVLASPPLPAPSPIEVSGTDLDLNLR